MVRSAPGLWTAAPTLKGLSENPGRRANSTDTFYPNKLVNPKVARLATEDTPIDYPSFSRVTLGQSWDRHPTATDLREEYVARSKECRRMASAAADPSIQLIHLDMAIRYEILAKQSEKETRQLHSVK
jgi:hypothetical protein